MGDILRIGRPLRKIALSDTLFRNSKQSNMDLEALRIFVKVAELGSFTRAAEQLGMPKSRASLRVRALEEALGTHLLQRTTRAVRLTPDGEQMLARARRLVLEADELSGMFA